MPKWQFCRSPESYRNSKSAEVPNRTEDFGRPLLEMHTIGAVMEFLLQQKCWERILYSVNWTNTVYRLHLASFGLHSFVITYGYNTYLVPCSLQIQGAASFSSKSCDADINRLRLLLFYHVKLTFSNSKSLFKKSPVCYVHKVRCAEE